MNISKTITVVAAIAMALSLSAVGCKHKPVSPTPIPGQDLGGKTSIGTPPPTGDNTLPPVNPIGPVNPIQTDMNKGTDLGPSSIKPNPDGSLAQPDGDISKRPQDRERLKAFTVLFDFDRAVVRQDQVAKVEAVAAQFKNGPAVEDMLIEGHCDERGTEEYNRSLGERRALALREMLAKLGVNPAKVYTLTFGKSKPVDPGHNEAAWSKNRRGEFIILLPEKK